MSFGKSLKEGLITDNPTLVQLIGLCPTLATTTSITNGIGMGLSATAVLICSNIVISLLRKIIPNKVRIAAYITVIAGFVTMVDLLLQAYIPSLSASLGTFIPLIVVNCIILGRAEAFASKNSVGKSAVDGICMGLGFTFALVCMSIVRELLGAGTIGGGAITVFSQPATIMILPAGAFLTLGCIIAIMQKLLKKGE
ncbi:MAG: electron transport complex subunit E [Eubacteriales bacterium]|nr:electron transport complex subunit E [Eubacteriales bacterium]